jgi:hypothetical protein
MSERDLSLLLSGVGESCSGQALKRATTTTEDDARRLEWSVPACSRRPATKASENTQEHQPVETCICANHDLRLSPLFPAQKPILEVLFRE